LIFGKHQVLEVDNSKGGPFYVRGDRVRLVQALGNVLHNAAKYTDSGGTLRVDVKECDDGDVAISVTDNGAGIAADLMPHIFDPFVQSERTLTARKAASAWVVDRQAPDRNAGGGSIDARSGGARHGRRSQSACRGLRCRIPRAAREPAASTSRVAVSLWSTTTPTRPMRSVCCCA
jgi:hypothetical protein